MWVPQILCPAALKGGCAEDSCEKQTSEKELYVHVHIYVDMHVCITWNNFKTIDEKIHISLNTAVSNYILKREQQVWQTLGH